MIKLFDATDKIYTSNGDKIILPLKAKGRSYRTKDIITKDNKLS